MPKLLNSLTNEDLIIALEYHLLQQQAQLIQQKLTHLDRQTTSAPKKIKPTPLLPAYQHYIQTKKSTTSTTISQLYTQINFPHSPEETTKYLMLRQQQIKEFAAMQAWYNNQKTIIEKTLLTMNLSKEQFTKELQARLQTAFIAEYQSKIYGQQTTELSGNYPHPNQTKILQLYALMELFANIEFDIQENSFTFKLKQDDITITLLTGSINNGIIEISCNQEILTNPMLINRALLLIVDQCRSLFATTKEQGTHIFPIIGNGQPELLLKLYQLALIENLNPVLSQDCLTLIINCDKTNNTHYGQILAHFMLIKRQAGNNLNAEEIKFIHQQLLLDPSGKLKEFFANIQQSMQVNEGTNTSSTPRQSTLTQKLQTYSLQQLTKTLIARYTNDIQEQLTASLDSAEINCSTSKPISS